MRTYILLPILFISAAGFSQEKKNRVVDAKRTTGVVKIDGLLNDAAWKDAALMTDMVEFRPKVGAMEDANTKTTTYLMYNDEGIYFGGICREKTKDSIATQLMGVRDGFGNNDYIGIIFDTYDDKLNGFEYFVTPLGEQWDAKQNPPSTNGDSEDFTWNAVWQSGAHITDSGWTFEMFIPFSAIRFGKKDVQDWGINTTRRRQKTQQQNTWNPIDPNVNGFLTQEGTWKGISNIKPPLRLQLSPYFSVYANHYPYNDPTQRNWTSQVNGGLDLKYGINQAFTLDATLIPDFGQVQSDNQVLNLTPFEVKYNEYRNFFTEGTELFSKGNLFYSRRIGGSPIHEYEVYNNLDSNETVLKNPTESKLINATKVSGRTQGGLGIGFLNAITKAQYATIENTATKEERKILTDPLTNYNVLVLDQTMKNNSSVTLINTNVWRSGQDYDANVTAGLFELNDKKNTYNLGGKLAASNRVGFPVNGKTETGISHEIHVGKTSGRFNFNLSEERTDDKYSSDDMGYFTNNNYLDHYLWMGYHWTEPHGFYNRLNLNFNIYNSMLAKKIEGVSTTYQSLGFNVNANTQTKKLWFFGAWANYNFKSNDFYEPRETGWYLQRNGAVALETWFESNSSKKYSLSGDFFGRFFINYYNSSLFTFSIQQSMRFTKKFAITHTLNLSPKFNNIGYTYIDGSTDINMARRKVNTVENILGAQYSFSNKMGITFRARHYLSSVKNSEFYILQHDGTLLLHENYHPDADQNVNFFNIDMVYSWQFAPGSFLNVVWKNATQLYTTQVEDKYFRNLSNTLSTDNNNNFSLKVIYFLDYNNIVKRKPKA